MAIFGNRIRVGDLLVQKGYLTEDQLSQALEMQREQKGKLGEVLINMGFVTEEQFSGVICAQLGIESVDIKGLKPNEELFQTIGEDIMRKDVLVPIGYDENDYSKLKVAMSDPMNLGAIDDVQIVTGLEVTPVYASSTAINIILDKVFGKKQAMEAAEQFQAEHADEFLNDDEENDDDSISDAPIVKIVNTILDESVRMDSSDIHIEPLEDRVRVRFRVDGVLQEVFSYNSNVLAAMVARIKIISALDISEKRKPQDGRLTRVVDGEEYDVRVSILPTVYGEKTVMRMTKKRGLTREKKHLGLYPDDEKKLDGITHNPHGIILVTGPTGSGKSTTCYTVLHELNKETVNIITVEDPVEANVPGVNQVQVNVKAELTFASALRSILRQDPDIIMIGEIRDGETAGIAVKASITGHLVISTLHTNSTSASITRLIDMGVESYLIGDAVVGIIAQRLVRRLCPKCKIPHEATEREKQILGVPQNENLIIYEPGGCDECNHGYKGRVAIYEIMPITSGIRRILHQKVTADEIQEVAVREGMNTLRMAGARNVREGITSIEEMVRVAYDMDEEVG
ncbi:MAG: Flp pilus assembly complex ATPase component TadA [Lachnospiraceae bacterium]|nr:Flp pilus assembly complex ATPase component TadA [Lachnospiraceae bacterium]